jgi:protein tyrosine kinase modulator
VLETLGSNNSYASGEAGPDLAQSLNINYYVDILKQKFFYFFVPFALISVAALAFAAIQKPNYLSEGKILVETQAIAPDIVRPVTTATANERVELIRQHVVTRDNLLSIANRFGLFPNRSEIFDLMRKSLQIKLAEVDGQPAQNTPAIAFTVGFEYPNPELAMRVANEFVTMIVGEDSLSRTRRSTEAVKILTDETKGIENKLESTQTRIFEVERQPHVDTTEISEQQKAQVDALAALKADLIQKMSVYSSAHPVVIALKKRIAAMERTIAQSPPTPARPTKVDDIDALKARREALEKRLADANAKLATAHLSERLNQDQQSDRLQVIEPPQLPQKPVKSKRLKMIAISFAAAMMLGLGCAIGPDILKGAIRDRHQLSGVVASSLIITIPYIKTRSDVIRARMRLIFGVVSVVFLFAIWGGLATAIVLQVPLDSSLLGKAVHNIHL